MCEALRDLFKDELQEQYEEGVSQGISQGVRQGITQRDIAIIRNMQKNKFTMNQIMLATGKTETEIKEILESV